LGLTARNIVEWARSDITKRSALTLFLTFTYALVLFPYVPFYVATPIFIFIFVISTEALTRQSWPKMRTLISALILAIVAGVTIGYVFQELFYVQLPKG
jgi:xanthine/uracil/vitamin C permease (AzgA family)